MPLINFEINVISNCWENCFICKPYRVATFAIAETQLYVLVVTLPTQNNTKLLQQLETFEQLLKILTDQDDDTIRCFTRLSFLWLL